MPTDASPASRTSAPAGAPASAFTNDQNGVKRTGTPSVGQTGTVTPGGGAAIQFGRTLGPESMQTGSGAKSKPHSNSGGGDRAEADAAADSTTNRGKPTKDQKTFNESRSNNTRTTGPVVTSGSGRAPGAAVSNLRTGNAPAEAAGKPAPAEATPGSTNRRFK